MTTWLFGFSAVALVAVGFRFFNKGATLGTWIEHAVETEDVTRLVEHIERSGPETATSWDQAAKALWDSYNRVLAVQLVVAGVQNSDATVFQFWIRRILEVEPALAQEYFSEEFLATYFQPEVAAKCGGGCGCG